VTRSRLAKLRQGCVRAPVQATVVPLALDDACRKSFHSREEIAAQRRRSPLG
jgi:hypothetical protein